ncbi:methyltransferase domain-containing protein [Candidatus Woesearchaeota archaeon]|nr:methyltransferase domain-containing protein [Candidatus Woesearchaeota archaeon]
MGKYDIIICTWVLSHLKSPSSLVNNAQKLLKRHGKFFLMLFTRPKWYLRWWLYPASILLFRAHYLNDEEIRKFKNVKALRRFSANIATTVTIKK